MMIRFFLCAIFVFELFGLCAQPTDTLYLPEFEKSELRFRQVRELVPTIETDSAALEYYRQGTVVDVLQNTLPLIVRNYGPTHSISISNRGLAAAHTAVFWNGINMNSPTTGLADFSLIPGAFVESMALSQGGGGSVLGSGPIGGGVHLNHRETADDLVRVEWLNTLTNTRNLESSLRTVVNSEKWTSRTNVVWHEGQNRFPFVHHAKRDEPIEIRENSHFRQKGFTQSVGRRLGRHRINIDLWGLETDRQLAPSLTASDNNERQYDRNLKAVIQAHLEFNRLKARIQTGYLDDFLTFENENGVDSEIRSGQFLFNADFTSQLNETWQLLFGTNNSLQQANSTGNYHQQETLLTNALYTGAKFRTVNEKFSGSVVLRYDHFMDYRSVVSPSLAMRYQMSGWLKWQLSASRNYRIPGFNDRFWAPGGNPDLEPEDAYQLTSGPELDFFAGKRKTQLSLHAHAYYNFVNNWIQWVPQGNYWGAVSYKSVNTYGLNARVRFRQEWHQTSMSVRVDYVLTEARNLASEYAETLEGTFLPHVPMHKTTSLLSFRWRGWSLYADASWTGSRFLSADNDKVMEPFLLANGGLSYDLRIKSFSAKLSGRVHNLLNTDYQVMPWMPMPLRTYSVSLKISFIKSKNQKK